MLPCLVKAVHLWRVFQVAEDEGRTQDVAGAYVTVVVSPLLNIGVAVLDVSDSGGGNEEEDLAEVIVVADGYKFYIIDCSVKDEAGGRRKGAKNIL